MADVLVFSLALPASWVEIDLDPSTRAESIRVLVAERAGDAARAGGPEALTSVLERAAAQAEQAGGVYAALYAAAFAGHPVSASLVVSPAGGPAGDLDGLGRDLVGEVVELPAGPAVRRRWRGPVPAGGSNGAGTVVDEVQYMVPAPGGEGTLVLSFSTPVAEVADAFAGLFDAVAATLCFIATAPVATRGAA